MSKIIGIFIAFIIFSGGLYLFLRYKPLPRQNPTFTQQQAVSTPIAQQKVDYEASFAIYTNGTFRVFTAAMYHNLSSDVYIQADNPNIVHVKKSGITWGDFFDTLPFKLSKECLTTGTKETFCAGGDGSLEFYLNGAITDNLLDLEIKQGDKALITFGNSSQTEIQRQIQSIPDIK